MIFSADERGKTGLIFYAAFLEAKNKVFPLPEGNAMTLQAVYMKKEHHITSNKVLFKTVVGGGLVVREHNEETNKDHFYSFDEEGFMRVLEMVLRNELVHAKFPEYLINEVSVDVISCKKILVKQYGIYVDANVGMFQVEGHPDILNYLYQAGMGSKRSMGYGLLDVVTKDQKRRDIVITRLENQAFNTAIEPSDWRYAAAIVGLEQYLTFIDATYDTTKEALLFNERDITESQYLRFVEYYYDDLLQHRELERKLHQDEFSEEQVKNINELLKANTVMKKVFGKEKFDGLNAESLLKRIEENRELLIKETFRNKKNMYANYANTGQLLEEGKEVCRLLGYYVDGGRKTKSISFSFDKNTFVAQDSRIFDFIPFAFQGGYDTFFINDSFTIKSLINTNEAFKDKIKNSLEDERMNPQKVLFDAIRTSADFIHYDVEIIKKSRDYEFFETMFIRKESIKILHEADKMNVDFNALSYRMKINDNYYQDIQHEVINAILNLTNLEPIIEICLKQKRQYLVSQLLKINLLVNQGGNTMNKSMSNAYRCAKKVVEVFKSRKLEKKIDSYRQKLISSIVAKDYDRFCQILLQLSNYADVNFGFAYYLFEDFEANKNVAYTFVNALSNQDIDREKTTQDAAVNA